MHELPLLINITIALVAAFFGGILAKRFGLPTIVGYLLAGIVIGPFTPGFVGDVETIQQLAELGVIFLMFGVGLHFSLQQLWRVRKVAIPGALIQTAIATLAGVGLTQLWGWSLSASVVLGLSISVASTVVLLRGLMDNNLLNTSHGQAAVGWLVMEDILSVLILVFMPVLVPGESGIQWGSMAITLLKAAAFGVIMFFVGTRLIPWMLERVAHMHSRELFILVVLVVTLGTAMAAAELFGVSLALGAFVAGAIISQSHLSHQVGADVFSFREAFSVLFFVSVGMLVNPVFLWQNLGQVAALSALVIVGKLIIVLLMSLFFPQPPRTFVIIAVGLSQVGEFSFILGQGGLAANLLTTNQYSLILAASLISMTANPFMYRLIKPLEKLLHRIPVFRAKEERRLQFMDRPEKPLKDHVVIIGYDRVGKHMVDFMHKIGLYGGLPGLILTHIIYGIPITTLTFRNYYASIPNELVEAAKIDGAGMLGIYWSILLPISLPSFVVVLIWQFTQAWNDFLFSVVLTSSKNWTVTVALNNLAGGQIIAWNVQMAASLLAALPTLLVYVLLGRYFIRGMMAGSLKG